MRVRKFVCALLLVITGLAVSAMKVSAEVKVTGIFSSHMVLQRDMPVPV